MGEQGSRINDKKEQMGRREKFWQGEEEAGGADLLRQRVRIREKM